MQSAAITQAHQPERVTDPRLRRPLTLFLLLLAPVMLLAMRFDPYNVDGDGVAYMDIADRLHAHRWAEAVNGYWHPLYPMLLCAAQVIAHPSRLNELGVYRTVNFFIFLAQAAAMLGFVTALVRLRDSLSSPPSALSLNAMRLLGLALLLISAQRELALGMIKPDGLLQALILAGLAMLLQALATNRLIFAPLMGLFFGLAYLTKSFAFLVALLSIAALIAFQWLVQRRNVARAVSSGALAFIAFAVVAGPYVAALSHQKHRLTFGDSGSLNYAWYVAGTEKMHLEPSMTGNFGAADVHLTHPEIQLLPPQTKAAGGVYSYANHALGTYPAWFDPTFFNDRITPHIRLGQLAQRDARNLVLIFRYILNHPEPLVLFAVLALAGAGFTGLLRTRFWWPAVALGLAMWGIYTLVNVEERYVTVAWFAVILPLFSALESRTTNLSYRAERGVVERSAAPSSAASLLIALFAFLALGETLRISLQERRDQSVAALVSAWRDPQMFGAAEGLIAMGVHPGDPIACVGTTGCLYDHYWARLAGVQILTEMYEPEPKHLVDTLAAERSLAQAYAIMRAQGAKVLVGHFDPGEMNSAHPAAAGWLRLGASNFYALPLNLPAPASPIEDRP